MGVRGWIPLASRGTDGAVRSKGGSGQHGARGADLVDGRFFGVWNIRRSLVFASSGGNRRAECNAFLDPYPDTDRFLDGNTREYADRDADGHPDDHINRTMHSHRHADVDSHAYFDAVLNMDDHGHVVHDRNTFRDMDTDRHTNGHADDDLVFDGNDRLHIDAFGNADAEHNVYRLEHRHCHANLYRHSDAVLYADINTHAVGHGYRHPYANRDMDENADTATGGLADPHASLRSLPEGSMQRQAVPRSWKDHA